MKTRRHSLPAPCFPLPAPRHSHGSALLLVMWALLLLSGAVLTWALWIQDGIQIHSGESRAMEARAMAHSGIALGLNPLITQKSLPLAEELGPGMGYKIGIISEGAKLNINWLLRGEEPRKLAILKQWLELRGVEFKAREIFVDCLLDYVDPDDLHRLNGLEDEGDYHPANRELLSVDEIAAVRGSEALTAQPGWKDDLTIYSQGPIDLGSASANTMRLLPGLSEASIARFIQVRQGKDGIDGTMDDHEFKNLREIQSFLGLSDAQFKELGGLVIYKDPTVHITAEGHSGNVYRQVEVVARKGAGNPQILSWKE